MQRCAYLQKGAAVHVCVCWQTLTTLGNLPPTALVVLSELTFKPMQNSTKNQLTEEAMMVHNVTRGSFGAKSPSFAFRQLLEKNGMGVDETVQMQFLRLR